MKGDAGANIERLEPADQMGLQNWLQTHAGTAS